ncbi:hypothetical protein DFQ29_007268 [Apophysomyces sp. BC1021]|nr:hypothetical protein DFQ29_007268 [Apophysomyces sp. BC1021]
MYKHGTQPQGCKALHYSYLYTINLTMDFMYGHHFDTFDDPAYRELHRMAGDFAEAVNYLLIEYPQSIYFMLGRLKKMAKHVQDEFQRILGGYNALMREAVANGREIDCTYTFSLLSQSAERNTVSGLMYDMVQAQEKEGLTEIDLGNLAANILVAAVDTTAVSMQNLFLILVNRPDIQRKVQDELDRVVGDRMPTDQDLKDLPYVEAVTTELLRFRPPLFLNMAHSARERQVYRGYEIPEGVGIFHNIYSTNFEEAIYPNPEVFNPDRFYKPENPVQREHWTFGAGRRLCPGNQFAEKSLLLTTARVLWAFDLVHPRDANGDKIDVPMSEIVQPFPQPPDVNITFVPRHANLAEQLHLSS